MPVPIGLAVTRTHHGNFRQAYRSLSTKSSLPATVVFMPIEDWPLLQAKALNFRRGNMTAGSPRRYEEVFESWASCYRKGWSCGFITTLGNSEYYLQLQANLL
jgi:hypothetical protein